MSRLAHAQAQTFLHLLHELRPFFRSDRNFPARLQQRLARERKFGSRDRRLYRELIYTALRYLPWIEAVEKKSDAPAAPLQIETHRPLVATTLWLAGQAPGLDALRETFLAGWPTRPATLRECAATLAQHLALSATPALPLPPWFERLAPPAFVSPECEILLTRAPVWLRLQTSALAPLLSELAEKKISHTHIRELLPALHALGLEALKLNTDADLTSFSSYQNGDFEIQDLGSQLLLAAALPAQPAGHWLDACAGAGGKTLQLARLLGPRGRVDATDPRASALRELQQRAVRSRISNISTLSAPPPADAVYDGVLIDAPCSGSGTWRRAPHLKWTTTAGDIEAQARLQFEILTRYAAHVKPGGQLIYATCSLASLENESVVAAFLAAHPEFVPAPLQTALRGAGDVSPAHALTLWPSRFDTDGYFVASLRRG